MCMIAMGQPGQMIVGSAGSHIILKPITKGHRIVSLVNTLKDVIAWITYHVQPFVLLFFRKNKII